ncbi:MAG TPA: phosphoglucosamine mutase [Blastocatellia bacterium]|nr:phosphoglucosamine mutase [Blastocatellia bacterium]
MKPLKIGIAGVRGIVGETLTPELVIAFAQAFGTYLDSGRILICRDTRASGPMVRAAVAAGLLASGCEVIDLGICPTPTMQLAVEHFNAAGGISITAGHNPAQWNALKFVRSDGLYLNTRQAEELLDIYHQAEFAKAKWNEIQSQIQTQDAIAFHIEALKQVFDVESIRARKLTVAVDCCNGACAVLSPRWLEELGCKVLAINDEIGSPFPHNPEPKRETMAQLRAVVKAGQADIGFAHDADGERLAIVTETGEALSEEMTLAIAAEIKLSQKPGVVVTHLSTSGAIEAIAARHNSSVVRTPVGQAYISEAMLELSAVLGGEGNGAVAIPEIHATNDSAATIGLILEYLAKTGKKISELVASLPRFTMLKHYVSVAPNKLFSVLNEIRLEAETAGATDADFSDGVKLTWLDGWLHIRASNTESMIRVIAEANEVRRVEELMAWAIERVR